MQFRLPDAYAQVFGRARGGREHAFEEDPGAFQANGALQFFARETSMPLEKMPVNERASRT
jgi:hypothetical protein